MFIIKYKTKGHGHNVYNTILYKFISGSYGIVFYGCRVPKGEKIMTYTESNN